MSLCVIYLQTKLTLVANVCEGDLMSTCMDGAHLTVRLICRSVSLLMMDESPIPLHRCISGICFHFGDRSGRINISKPFAVSCPNHSWYKSFSGLIEFELFEGFHVFIGFLIIWFQLISLLYRAKGFKIKDIDINNEQAVMVPKRIINY